MAVNCELPTLQQNAKCYIDQCNSEAEREAIEIYLRVQALAAQGGASYNPASLQVAAKAWQGLSAKQLEAINTYITWQNASDNGATPPSNINALKAAAACFLCIPEANRKQVLLFLRCALSNLAVPD